MPHQTADYAGAFYRGYGDTYGLHTLASVAGGGKFANGAITGAFGYLFNDLAVDAKGKLNYVPSQVGSELDVYEDFAANPQHTYPLALPLGAFGGAAALEALAGVAQLML